MQTAATGLGPTLVQTVKIHRHRRQLAILLIMLAVYAFSAFLSYALFFDQLTAYMSAATTPNTTGPSPWVLGLLNALITLVIYGLLGLAAYWFAFKLGLPRIYSEDGNWTRWVGIPFALGLGCGLLEVVGDIAFAPINSLGRFIHPPFPVSILATVSAGIGEEIMFRGLVFGLWAFVVNWLLKRWPGRTTAFWIANVIAALLFGAGQLGTIMILTHAASPADIHPVMLVEMFLLNGIIGLVAGQRYMKDGLVAAVGVHFWCDIVFHVVWGLL